MFGSVYPSTPSRKELQALAKQNGISANQKSSDIISQLERLQSNSQTPPASQKPRSSEFYDEKTRLENVDGGKRASQSRRRSLSRSKPPSPTSVLHEGISDVDTDSESTASVEENVNSVPLSPQLKGEVREVEQEISDEIKRVDVLLRSKHPVLLSPRYQSALGMSIMVVFAAVILYCWKLYYDMCRGSGSEGVSGASKFSIAGLMLVIAFSARYVIIMCVID